MAGAGASVGRVVLVVVVARSGWVVLGERCVSAGDVARSLVVLAGWLLLVG